jgi:hypothetical protein
MVLTMQKVKIKVGYGAFVCCDCYCRYPFIWEQLVMETGVLWCVSWGIYTFFLVLVHGFISGFHFSITTGYMKVFFQYYIEGPFLRPRAKHSVVSCVHTYNGRSHKPQFKSRNILLDVG